MRRRGSIIATSRGRQIISTRAAKGLIGILLIGLLGPLLVAGMMRQSLEEKICIKTQRGEVSETGDLAKHDERVLSIDECARALREAEPAEYRDPCSTCHTAVAATEISGPESSEVAVRIDVDVGPLQRDVVPDGEEAPWGALPRPTWEARIEGPGAEQMGPIEVEIDETPGFSCVVRNRRLLGELVVGCTHPGSKLQQGVQTVGTLRFERPSDPVAVRPSKFYYRHPEHSFCERTGLDFVFATRWSDRGIAYYTRDCLFKDEGPNGTSPVLSVDFLDVEIEGRDLQPPPRPLLLPLRKPRE